MKLDIIVTIELDRQPTNQEQERIVKHIADALDTGEGSLYGDGVTIDGEYLYTEKFSCVAPLTVEHHFVKIKE
jgi:hypothetical protein